MPRQGHYEIRDHPSIAGLLNIMWCPDDQPSGLMVTIGEQAVPQLAQALSRYMRQHRIAETAEPEVDAPDELARRRAPQA